MADLRIERGPSPLGPSSITPDQRRGDGGGRRERQEKGEREPVLSGVEELAVALHEERRKHLAARLETDDAGETRVRVVDTGRGETVAVLTLDELDRKSVV